MTAVDEHQCVDAAAALSDAGLIALRRDLHRHPELAGGETRTAALVADRLRAAGLDVRTGVGGHGVVGVVEGRGDGPMAAALQAQDGPLATFTLVGSHLDVDGDPVAADVWVRVWPESRHPELRDELRRLAAAEDATVTFDGPPFPAMICSPELSEAAAAHLRDVPGVAEVLEMRASWPFSGEDFALFLHRVPGAMFFLGVADAGAGLSGVPHAPDFGADERAIGLGVRAMTGLLLHRLRAA